MAGHAKQKQQQLNISVKPSFLAAVKMQNYITFICTKYRSLNVGLFEEKDAGFIVTENSLAGRVSFLICIFG